MNEIKRVVAFLILILTFFSVCKAQDTIKKWSLDHTVYDSWKDLANPEISCNGKWVSYEINPQKGDGSLVVTNVVDGTSRIFPRATKASFSGGSDFVVFMVKPPLDTIRQMKLAKKKNDDLPKDSLIVWVFETDKIFKFARIKSYKIADENSSWLAYHCEKEGKEEKDKVAEKEDKKGKEKKKRKKDAKKDKKTPLKDEGTDLVMFNPITGEALSYKSISEYETATKGSLICFIKHQKDSTDLSSVYVFNANEKKEEQVFSKRGISKKTVIDEKGTQIAFIHSEDTTKVKTFSLFYWKYGDSATSLIVDTLTKSIPKHWTVSEHSVNYFSKNGSKLIFGTALKPEKEKKDSLLDEEKVRVDVWHYDDPDIQPQQLISLDKDLKRSYLAVYHIDDKKVVQLADSLVESVQFILKGDGDVCIGYDFKPYKKRNTWDYPSEEDVYIVDVRSGDKKLIWKKHSFYAGLSSEGNYLLKFNIADSAWYSYNLSTEKLVNLTGNLPVNFYNEKNDTPDLPNSYGLGGWTEGDSYILINDMFDIWKVDPDGEETPINLTNNFGRRDSIQLRCIRLDQEAFSWKNDEKIMLSAFNVINKERGFYTTKLDISNEDPNEIFMEDFSFSTPVKAKNSEKLIWNKGNFNVYNDLWYSDTDFKNSQKLSDVNPQQANYLWGTVEITKWKHNGIDYGGLIYKPENFDPEKKYPAIVYFYEKYTDHIHDHYTPRPSRSVINFPYYASNGYVIFVPDIYYGTGQPGKDAEEAVISGTKHLIDLGFVDKDRLGLQGQSWGGYQVAWLVTQTDMFAAAEAGAPVSNMTSAYGGIRWSTGLSRMFQYEKGQSRIGVSLWEDRQKYIENSPLFYADRVTTPLLIMHNDEDGAVPWYQSIEYYSALRRLDKQVWLLTYNKEEHNLRDRPNCVDLSIRMQQFFDHFLKGEPAPEWLIKGIPAIEKGKNNGYKLLSE